MISSAFSDSARLKSASAMRSSACACVQPAWASATSTLSRVASVCPARTRSPSFAGAEVMRPSMRGATRARRSWSGRMVAVTCTVSPSDSDLTGSTFTPARSASSLVSVSSSAPSACSSFFSPACSACLSPSAACSSLAPPLPQAASVSATASPRASFVAPAARRFARPASSCSVIIVRFLPATSRPRIRVRFGWYGIRPARRSGRVRRPGPGD